MTAPDVARDAEAMPPPPPDFDEADADDDLPDDLPEGPPSEDPPDEKDDKPKLMRVPVRMDAETLKTLFDPVKFSQTLGRFGAKVCFVFASAFRLWSLVMTWVLPSMLLALSWRVVGIIMFRCKIGMTLLTTTIEVEASKTQYLACASSR